MKGLVRWIVVVLSSLLALIVVACAVVYIMSERILRRTYDVPAVAAISIPTDAESIAEGRRLATIRGCFGGCHGKNAEGVVMFDEPLIARIVAPNLTASVRQHTDAQLDVIIRHGLRPDGHSVLVMPAEEFMWLTDADFGRILAFLKSLPPSDGPGPNIASGPLGRIGLATGKFKTVAQLIADAKAPPEAKGDQATLGRYLARTTCASCHGTDLRGASTPDFVAPDLRIAGAYSPEQFTDLIRKGESVGGRKLGTMGPWARQALSSMKDEEIAALYSYLHEMP
jgi:mono/diheme cytochrome c family protein